MLCACTLHTHVRSIINQIIVILPGYRKQPGQPGKVTIAALTDTCTHFILFLQEKILGEDMTQVGKLKGEGNVARSYREGDGKEESKRAPL